MTDFDAGRPWRRVYSCLRVLGPDTFVAWGSFEGMTNKARDASRSALTRARVELEAVDGLTVGGQNKDGFWIWALKADS